MSSEYQIIGWNPTASFTLKLHQGDAIALVAMNWKIGKPELCCGRELFAQASLAGQHNFSFDFRCLKRRQL
jgi:hypothetical protein